MLKYKSKFYFERKNVMSKIIISVHGARKLSKILNCLTNAKMLLLIQDKRL